MGGLRVENLDVFYGMSQALFGLSLEIGSGEVVTLLGRNGMGKTTTVHAVMGIVPVRSGRVTFEGKRLEGLPSYRIARQGLGLVPEGRQTFPNLTVWENLVATAANRSTASDPWTPERIFDIFAELDARRKSMAATLSGGEQQMLAIGRALMTNPRLLILDDATEGLAPLIRGKIWRCLAELKRSGQSILVIDKNRHDLARLADRHYILEKGTVAWTGDSAELRESGSTIDRLLGV